MVVVSGAGGFAAVEAGWMVTEVGRQPWDVQGLMRTADAVTSRSGVAWHLGATLIIYALLGVACSWLLLRLAHTPPEPSLEPGASIDAGAAA